MNLRLTFVDGILRLLLIVYCVREAQRFIIELVVLYFGNDDFKMLESHAGSVELIKETFQCQAICVRRGVNASIIYIRQFINDDRHK